MKMLDIPAVEAVIGYTFQNKALLRQAFTRESYCHEHRSERNPIQSNEVLEFCGDAVLGAVVITVLMERYSELGTYGITSRLKEGDFSVIKSSLSDKRMLSDRIRELKLYEYLLLNHGDEKMQIATQPSVMEDLFESILGAVYLDCGKDLSTVGAVVCRMLDVERYFEKHAGPVQRSYKNLLQEWCQGRGMERPVYTVVAESGPDHEKSYTVLCAVEGVPYETGVGKNKKKAEAEAAEKTYLHLTQRSS